ncbi:MAG TPA: S-layer homology domain-containing protein, partial [Acidimicrobiia bacterium]|nr:S-layer homology domain-containing protein [Acidimicrobiia bacterium]
PPANSRFCPDRRMTRAEFATFIVRALGLPPTDIDYFSDDNGHVLEGAINRLAEAGITKGCNPPANDRFCPQSLLTRADTATFMTRAFRLTG